MTANYEFHSHYQKLISISTHSILDLWHLDPTICSNLVSYTHQKQVTECNHVSHRLKRAFQQMERDSGR